jgi:hypothetical protein
MRHDEHDHLSTGAPMTDNRSLTIELQIQRASTSATALGLTRVVKSLTEALKEARESGLQFPAVAAASAHLDKFLQVLNRSVAPPSAGTIGRRDLAQLRDALAVSAWTDPKNWFSEVALSDLHSGRCGWGPSADASGPVRTIELAIDVIDFCDTLLGPADALTWTLRDPTA